MPDPYLGRPRAFTRAGIERVLGPWYETASVMDRFHVNDTLLDIAGGQWVERRDWVPDAVRTNDYHVLARSNLVVTIRLAQEYPSFVQLVRIGAFGNG